MEDIGPDVETFSKRIVGVSYECHVSNAFRCAHEYLKSREESDIRL